MSCIITSEKDLINGMSIEVVKSTDRTNRAPAVVEDGMIKIGDKIKNFNDIIEEGYRVVGK